MLGQRGHLTNNRVTVDILSRSSTGSTATVYSDQTALHWQTTLKEAAGPFGEVATRIVDIFGFEETADCVLPTITEENIVSLSDTLYEVIRAKSYDARKRRLIVETERAR